MTRLQNAEKRLSDALAALESALESASVTSASAAPFAAPSAAASRADLSALVDEVSGIEAKLGEAMQIIAAIDAGQTSTDGNKGDSE